ncbi:hypothetical protein PILCRDRAFT_17257 [Piloderma croceum F 1598]|uniref:CCHC-type domain-containing protein n=1 Tax=Piloderma croceum (strain F 1598) TaxID=765440 RepID=A0A0C3ET04_PILCF|nr:hypothetical protein PILCRDRAFT_17257 [Piloderma croceum F 1598]
MDSILGDDDFGDDGTRNDTPDDPENPEDPDDEPPDNNPDDDDDDMQNNLAHAIAVLARNVRHQGDGPHSKVQEPDPFNGTDPAKLRTFLKQSQLCNIISQGHCTGPFRELIEPDLLHPPAWGDDYGDFIAELNMYFRSLDLVGKSVSKLENLSMKPTQRIAKYLVKFNRLATIMGWDNRTLRHQFYHGLPARIKDEVLRSTEKRTEKPQSQPSSSNQGSQNKQHKKLFVPRESGSSTQNSNKRTSDLGDKLRKDGKLTSAERACHFANNLCLFCGGVGHTAKECLKSSSSAAKAKGRATKAKSNKPETTPAKDSKK